MQRKTVPWILGAFLLGGALTAVVTTNTDKPLIKVRPPTGEPAAVVESVLQTPARLVEPAAPQVLTHEVVSGVIFKKETKPEEIPWQTDDWAVSRSVADLLAGSRELVLKDPVWSVFQRYVFSPTGELEDLKAASLTGNYALRPLNPIKPDVVNRYLIRFDLRKWAKTTDDLNEIIKVWEEFRFDPRFSLLLTKDTLRFAAGLDLDREKVNLERVGADIKGDVLRLPGEHLNPMLWNTLVGNTQSQAPVVSLEYFVTRALTTIKDQDNVLDKDGKEAFKDNVYSTIWGGLYYDLSGIKTGFKKGTDEDNLLEQVGIGNVEAGVTADKLFERLGSQFRAAMEKSEVSRKFRGMDLFQQPGGNPYLQIGSVTHDFLRKNIDLGSDAVSNLGTLRGKDDAREEIFTKPNGFHLFALFNGKGLRQNAVPVAVATNGRIPHPNEPELQPAIDCIDCHGTSGGWKYFKNDVPKAIKGGFDIFNDLRDPRLSRSEVVNLLAKEYTADPEETDGILDRARRDYDRAVLKATGTWASSTNQTDLVKLSAEKLVKIHRRYRYDQVDAEYVLKDLGLPHPKALAKDSLKLAVPPVLKGSDGGLVEDRRIGWLTSGQSILPTNYALVRSIIARRAQLEAARRNLHR